ncbi:cyclomaltodextrinase N-terminal domain-containing protein, partial [Pseudoduganella sp. RAF53_2]
MTRSRAALLLAGALLFPLAHAQDYRVQHMEPAFWWSGMHDPHLQLMVHGPKLGDLEPSVNYPGVRIASVAHVANHNYLFIDLQLDGAAPGKFDIVFSKNGKPAARYT